MMRNVERQLAQSIKLLNTREAARFLRVSDASIRRWSDAGLLNARRLGRRRERRFSETDLLAFMTPAGSGQPQAPSLPSTINIGGAALPLGSHLATFYGSDSGRLRLTVPLFAEGLRVGQPCFLAASGSVLDAYLDALRATPGVDLDGALRSGQLYTADGPGASTADALAFWEQLFWKALAGGPNVLRIVGEMACELEGFDSADEMIRYEEAFSAMAKRFPTITLCQYDAREFDGATVLSAIRAHPDLYNLNLGTFLN
jgi:excisionase family DNA binding protein